MIRVSGLMINHTKPGHVHTAARPLVADCPQLAVFVGSSDPGSMAVDDEGRPYFLYSFKELDTLEHLGLIRKFGRPSNTGRQNYVRSDSAWWAIVDATQVAINADQSRAEEI